MADGDVRRQDARWTVAQIHITDLVPQVLSPAADGMAEVTTTLVGSDLLPTLSGWSCALVIRHRVISGRGTVLVLCLANTR